MLQQIYDTIDPVAFSIASIDVRWYGIAYLLAFVICPIVALSIAKRWKTGIVADDILMLLLCVIVGTILGARLGYMLFYTNGEFFSNPARFFDFKGGGMSFHGGLIGIVLGGIVASRVTKISFLTLADLVAIVAPIGLFLGRCANFINGELWGAVTELPWGVVFEGAGDQARHPSQLYEAMLEGVLIFVVLFLLSRKKPPLYRGSYIALFLMMYGVCRIAIEFVREPDSQIGYLFGDWLTMGMVLSLPVLIAGIALFIYAQKKKMPQFCRDGCHDGSVHPSK